MVGGEWLPNGKEITYLTLDVNLMSVEVKADASGFEAGAPKVLFNASNGTFLQNNATGDRELLAVLPPAAQNTPITLVSNWPAALKK